MRWITIALLLATAAPALAQDGSGSLSGTTRVKVKPDCGKDRLQTNKRRTRAKLTMAATGTGATIEGTGKLEAILRGQWVDAP